MKIAINCAFFQPKSGGIKEYIYNLVNNLALLDVQNEYVLYVLEDYYDFATQKLPNKYRIKTIPFKSHGSLNLIYRGLFDHFFWLNEEREEKWDIFHSPFFHSPKFRRTKVLLTVHDLRFTRYPETYTRLRYLYLKYKVKQSIKRAAHIISISEFTKQEIIDVYEIPSERVSVVYEAVNPLKFADNQASDNCGIAANLSNARFILTVGAMEPRKNFDRLIDAFVSLKQDPGFEDLKLVFVGVMAHSFKKTLEKINATKDIIHLNFVEHPALIWLYKHADLFVFPSFYEGFGFPPLEAASLGTVSAVSNISSMPEVCGDIAFYFNPFDTNDIKNTLKKGLKQDDDYRYKKTRLNSQLEKFSWKNNALETIRIYEKII